MQRMGAKRVLALVACALVFVAGAGLVYAALDAATPEGTPVPDREFSLSREDALALDREVADRPIGLPTGQDLGPFVNTSPVTVPDDQEDVIPAGPGPDDAVGRLYVPSLYVSAPIVPQGVTSANEMSLPDDLHHVGLLDTTSALDDEAGSTLIAGHVTAGGHPGALYFLGRAQPGASVTTLDTDGRRTDWVVTSVRSYHKTSLPADIFRTMGERTLTLVTCGGDIIRTPDGRWTHEDNIVVTAAPVDAG